MEYERETEKEKGHVLKTRKVVEYLVPKMSLELLCKFPDNSAYDFDYSQSTIWSPLLPRPYIPMDLDLITPRKLSYDVPLGVKKVGSKLRNKLNLNLHFTKKHGHSKKKKLPSDFSPTPFKGSCNPIMNKQWAKALKAASKQFKKWKMKTDRIAHAERRVIIKDECDFDGIKAGS